MDFAWLKDYSSQISIFVLASESSDDLVIVVIEALVLPLLRVDVEDR